MLKPVQKQSLSNQVFNQLRDEILGETYHPGDRLPSERELCDILQINRSSVREALKKLEQARLIEIRHGEGSVVLDFHSTAGFEILTHMVQPGGRLNYVALRSVAEVRAVLVPEMARLAALRIQEPELERMAALVEELEKCGQDDAETFQSLDFEFHYAMARAGENLAILLMMNSIKDIYLQLRPYFAVMFEHVMADTRLYRKILKALAAGDAVKTEAATRELIQGGTQAFLDILEQLNVENGD